MLEQHVLDIVFQNLYVIARMIPRLQGSSFEVCGKEEAMGSLILQTVEEPGRSYIAGLPPLS